MCSILCLSAVMCYCSV